MAWASKVPVYPRPVSPLSAESLHLEQHDVLYASSCSSADDDSEARAAKRRRVQKLGEQYLRGDGLQILSAGLKGPFDSGWQNPWTKRKRDTGRAVVETPQKGGHTLKSDQAQKIDHTNTKNSKVEEWLRRNSLCSGVEIEYPSSPMSPCTRILEFKHAGLAKQAGKAARNEPSEPSRRPPSKPDLGQANDKPNLEQHTTRSGSIGSPSARDCSLEDELIHNRRMERRVWVSHASNVDEAKFADLKLGHSVLDIAPPPTMMRPPFKNGRDLDEDKKHRRFEESGDRTQGGTESMAPPATNLSEALASENSTGVLGEIQRLLLPRSNINAPSRRINPHPIATTSTSAIPALSTDTSRASMANLPSAQPQSLAVPTPSTNNLTVDEQMVEQIFEPVEPTQGSLRSRMEDETQSRPVIKQLNDPKSKLRSAESQILRRKNKAEDDLDRTLLPADIVEENLNCHAQAKLADMNRMNNTVRSTTTDLQARATPVTAAKPCPQQSAKSASFAQYGRVSSPSSQKSLKMSFRVSKRRSSVAMGKENQLANAGEGKINTECPDLFSDLSNKELLSAASPGGVKSTLHSSELPSLRTPFPSNKESISTGVDGGQNAPMVEHDTFDLEAATDGLGSYLGTWNIEKEASRPNM